MITLRPHHLKSIINFSNKKYNTLTEEEYLLQFRKVNWKYHNDAFIIYWKNFQDHLINNLDTKFKYEYSYNDNACIKCDLIDECKDKNSKLHELVHKLDDNFLIKNRDFRLNEIYTIRELFEK